MSRNSSLRKGRRDLLSEVTGRREEQRVLLDTLVELVDECQRQGTPDGTTLARARSLLDQFSL